ncbi:MAG: polysaccharide deacetylase family protein [Nitrospiraceae bacterium]
MTGRKPGTMVVSLDLELAWGRFDHIPLATLENESRQERKHIPPLLALFDRYDIPATWAVVGHLMLEKCRRDHHGMAHPDLFPHAYYSWFPRDWYSFDPCTTVGSAPAWYAPDIVEWIRRSRVHHEIGSHSFGHIYYGDSECTPSVALADLNAALQIAALQGIVLKSFVFPRNQVGHLDVLKRFGLRSYRGAEPPLIRTDNRVLQKAVHFFDQLLALRPRAVRVEETLPGLWNLPGNHFFIARDGMRRMIPMASRVLKGKRGITHAVKTGGLYHLWFHPFNLNEDTEAMLSGLAAIFDYAHHMREQGLLEILTMDDYARRLECEKPAEPHGAERGLPEEQAEAQLSV